MLRGLKYCSRTLTFHKNGRGGTREEEGVYIVPLIVEYSTIFFLLFLQKKWHLDIQNTPCARDALMHGIAGGLGVGLLYFMKSSERL